MKNCCKVAYQLANSEFTRQLLDECGVHRRHHGYKTFIKALRYLLGNRPEGSEAFGAVTYAKLVVALAGQIGCSERWVNNQMQYALDCAKKDGRLERINDYAGHMVVNPDCPQLPLSPAEFLAEIKGVLIREAIVRMGTQADGE